MCDYYQTLHWAELTPHAVGELAAYRYQVFVEHLGWPLACDHGRGEELDEFDLTGDTRYILRRNLHHELTGCARVMPAERGNVSRKLFTDLFERHPLPDIGGGWELSRLAATRPGPANAPRAYGSAMPLLGHVLSYAASEHVDELFAVSFLWLQKRWKATGLDVERAGPTARCDAVEIVAFKMNVANSLAKLQHTVRRVSRRGYLDCDGAGRQAPVKHAHS